MIKSKHILMTAVLLLPAIVFASGGSGSHYETITGRVTDFVPRVFNFLVFAGILYYLMANPIKSFFKGRKEGIANQLKEIENRLQQSKNEEKAAEIHLKESKKKADEIIETAGKEAHILSAKILENSENDLKVLDRQLEEKMALEERRSARETIDEILNNNITNDDILLGEKKVVELISKKVA